MTFPHTATIQRKTKVGTIYSFADLGTVKCFIQPIDMESAQAYGITFSKGSVCYTALDAELKEHDRLVYNGTTYGISGFRVHPYGRLRHKKYVLEAV